MASPPAWLAMGTDHAAQRVAVVRAEASRNYLTTETSALPEYGGVTMGAMAPSVSRGAAI